MTDDTRDVETTETAEAVEDAPTEAETEADDSVTAEKTDVDKSPKETERPRRDWSAALRKVELVPVTLVLLLLISGGLAAWLYFALTGEPFHAGMVAGCGGKRRAKS